MQQLRGQGGTKTHTLKLYVPRCPPLKGPKSPVMEGPESPGGTQTLDLLLQRTATAS